MRAPAETWFQSNPGFKARIKLGCEKDFSPSSSRRVSKSRRGCSDFSNQVFERGNKRPRSLVVTVYWVVIGAESRYVPWCCYRANQWILNPAFFEKRSEPSVSGFPSAHLWTPEKCPNAPGQFAPQAVSPQRAQPIEPVPLLAMEERCWWESDATKGIFERSFALCGRSTPYSPG